VVLSRIGKTHWLRLALLAAVGLSGFWALSVATELQTRTDLARMLPEGFEDLERYEEFSARFGSDRVLALVLVRPSGLFEPDALAELAALTDAVAAIPWVRRVEGITHTTSVTSSAGVMEARPLFTDPPFDEDDVAAGREELLTSPVFVRHLVSRTGGAAALMVFLEERTVPREVLRRLPDEVTADPVAFGEAGEQVRPALDDVNLKLALGELQGDPDELRVQRLRELTSSGADGGTTLAALVERLEDEAAAALLDYDREAVETVEALLEEHGSQVSATRIMVGAPVMRRAVEQRMALDVQQALLASVVLVFLLCWLALRDPLRVPLPAGAAIVGVVWTLGLVAALDLVVDQVTVAALFPGVALTLATATLICVDGHPRLPTLAGVVGAGAALAAMALLHWSSDIEAVRRFGFVLALGVLCGATASAVVVAIGLGVTPGRVPPAPRRPRRPLVSSMAVLLGFGAALGMARLSIGVDYSESLQPRDPLYQDIHTVEEHLAGMDAFRLHLRTDAVDRLKDPDVLTAVRQLQDEVEGRAGVDATLSYVDLIEAIYAALDPDREHRLPQTRTLVGQLLLLFGSPDALAPFVSADFDQAAITVRGTVGGGRELRRLVADAEQAAERLLPPDVRCEARGELLLTSDAAYETGRRMLNHAAHALILAVALCLVALRRVRPFMRLVVPPTMVSVAALGAANLGVPSLGPVTLAIPWIGLAAGLPVVLARARDGRPGARDWLSVAVVGACFAPLMASTLRFDAAVGIGVAVGCAAGALYLWGDGGVED